MKRSLLKKATVRCNLLPMPLVKKRCQQHKIVNKARGVEGLAVCAVLNTIQQQVSWKKRKGRTDSERDVKCAQK